MTRHKLIETSCDILGATYLGRIPWVFEDSDSGEPFVVVAHYYDHGEDRRIICTDETDEDIRQILLDVSDCIENEAFDAPEDRS